MQHLIDQFDTLAREYRSYIADKFSFDDFQEYNEVLFSAHSCAIEGNSFTVDETRILKEKGLGMIPQGKPLVEAFEMLDHFRAYEEMVRTVDAPLTEEYIKHLHFLLTEHTIAYRHPGAKPGEYTDHDMCAGDTIFGDHEVLISKVPQLLSQVEQALAGGQWHPMEAAAIFHGHFEWLHPFRDGNGRLGRLLSNKLLLRYHLPILIIESSQRQEYLSCMKAFRTDAHPLVDFFFRIAIHRMTEEIAMKKNGTENFRSFFHGDEK